jgi:dTDP-4-amino-4,6-dideoxygalactose transaminase
MMKIPFVDLRVQYNSIRSEIDAAIQSVIEQTAFIGSFSPFVQDFEGKFANYLGLSHVVS